MIGTQQLWTCHMGPHKIKHNVQSYNMLLADHFSKNNNKKKKMIIFIERDIRRETKSPVLQICIFLLDIQNLVSASTNVYWMLPHYSRPPPPWRNSLVSSSMRFPCMYVSLSSLIQVLFFSLVRVTNRYLFSASIRTHVVFVIFSFIIKSNAELSTVFSIWACNPLKKPSRPSLFQMAQSAPETVFWAFCSASRFPSSPDSAA